MRDLAYAEVEALLQQWPDLTPDKRSEIFHRIPRDQAADLFLHLSTHDQMSLLSVLSEGERIIWMRLLEPDDAADVIQEFPPEDRRDVLALLDETTRREVVGLLAYAEDKAGGLMNPRYAVLRPDMTVDEAIAYLRRQADEARTIYYAYVLDADQKLIGIVTFRHLLSATRQKTVREVMRTDFMTAGEDMDQEALAQVFAEHHFLALPVVDSAGRMKGVVTVDDIVDVVQEEASEDIQKIGGMEALEGPYLDTGLVPMIKKRAGWLSALFLGEMLTATAMGYYEAEIAEAVVLALFIPLIISSGGNSGSQATTLVIRAMALGQLRLRDWWRVIRREVTTGAALGAILGAIGMARILVWQAASNAYGEHYFGVALTVGFSLIGVVLFGTLAGSMLPFILRRLGFDPASASAPFVATLVDVTGLVIYFTMASIILRGTLL